VPMFFKIIMARKLREGRSTAEIKAEAEHAHAHGSPAGAHHHPVQHGSIGGPASPDVKGEPA
jgi:hypothetical protein